MEQDSITTGGPPFVNSYRKHLLDSLEGNTIDMVGPVEFGTMQPPHLNRMDAFMGRKINQMTTSLKTSLPEWKPDVILLHAGTNDVAPHEHTPSGIPDMLDELLETIHQKSPHAATIVAGIIPAAFREDQIQGFNKAVGERVEKRRAKGQRFVFIDMYPDWPPDAHADLVHPNDRGFKRMAELWLTGLERINGLGWIPSQ